MYTKQEQGFTLLELLVVMVIIGLLVSIVGPKYFNQLSKSEIKAAKAQMNALKNALGSLINIVAAAWFVASGLIDWPKAGVMTAGALVGYFVGAHYSQRIPIQESC